MANLEIKFEWEDAPGVREAALAATWARLEIWIGQECITRVLDKKTGDTRNGVYGSLLPFVEWLVENWWFLITEPQRSDRVAPGRVLSRVPTWRNWVHRHNLLAARSGGALPDLFFSRSDDYIAAVWHGDPILGEEQRVRFLSQGSQLIPLAEAREKLAALVSSVLDRLKAKACAYRPELFENWEIIRKADPESILISQRAARLGIDVYDSDEYSERLDAVLHDAFKDWPGAVIDEFLDSVYLEKIGDSIKDVSTALQALKDAHGKKTTIKPLAVPENPNILPYDFGYGIAREVREDIFSIDQSGPFSDFRKQVAEKFAWPSAQQCVSSPMASERINGLIGHSADGSLQLLTGLTNFSRQNFAIARGLFHTLMHHVNGTPVLLTSAHVYKQQAGRAFAAELLAPAKALGHEIRHPLVTSEELRELGDKFSVSPQVIAHQIENHNLADLEPVDAL